MPTAVALLNFMTIRELYYIFSVFPQTGIFRGFSLYIINFGGRISEAVMGGTGGIQCPILPKKTGVRSERPSTHGKIPLV